MLIAKIIELLDAKCVTYFPKDEKKYSLAFASDLMSDALALADESTILITGLNNLQVIRTAEMLDISLIILVRGKVPLPDIVKLANELKITILTTDYIMFKTCGILYQNGMMAK